MNSRTIAGMCMILIVLIVLPSIAFALPEGPSTFDKMNSTAKARSVYTSLNVLGGSSTHLNVNTSTNTYTWQGFVGNVTGTLRLDNAANQALYSWDVASPSGEVYASTSELDFSTGNIECYNFSKYSGTYYNITQYESDLGISTDVDSINETFTPGTTYDEFYAGYNLINKQCPETQLLNGSSQQDSSSFQEVLLYDNTADKVVYTSLMNDVQAVGYDGKYWDFEMIVAEKGSDGNQDTTTYYFYVELQ